MTATRWWVRLFARWQARIDSVKGQIQAASLAVTAFSTFSLVLQGFGLGQYVLPLGIVGAIAAPAYAYLYFEGGVWNQVSRDRADMGTNFAGPSMKMDDICTGAAVFAAVHGRQPTDDELALIEDAVDEPWSEFRNGLDAAELEDGHKPRP